jgi:hypothetical protein
MMLSLLVLEPGVTGIKEKPSMWIIGCDFHPAWQQVAMYDSETAELVERKLKHGDGEAEAVL